jgi:hypothetical protein
LQRRQSVLDLVREDANALHRQLGASDQQKLDEYLFAVRDIERRLKSDQQSGDAPAEIPDYPRPAGVPEQYENHVKLLFDMMTLALQTDSTRIITMMYANAGSNRNYPNIGVNDGHHDLSHHGGARAKQDQISKINQYHMQLFGYWLDQLAKIREGDGSLLDNCMIVYGSGIADGNSHDHDNLPIALLGRGGGTVTSGRRLRVRPGTPLTNLYCSMLERMGAAVDKFADSTGTIEDL